MVHAELASGHIRPFIDGRRRDEANQNFDLQKSSVLKKGAIHLTKFPDLNLLYGSRDHVLGTDLQ